MLNQECDLKNNSEAGWLFLGYIYIYFRKEKEMVDTV